MKFRLAICIVALELVSPLCNATVACADLEPTSPQFSNKLTSVGREAGIPADRFTQYHRQVVLSLCAGQQDHVEDLIDQGRVSAHQVGAIKKVLVLGDATAMK